MTTIEQLNESIQDLRQAAEKITDLSIQVNLHWVPRSHFESFEEQAERLKSDYFCETKELKPSKNLRVILFCMEPSPAERWVVAVSSMGTHEAFPETAIPAGWSIVRHGLDENAARRDAAMENAKPLQEADS